MGETGQEVEIDGIEVGKTEYDKWDLVEGQ